MKELNFCNLSQVKIPLKSASSKVPLEGFSNLMGIGGINKFKIAKVFDKNFDRLPTAHTWYILLI
jgi:E3 ubiquitin-protein ligase HUWE1